MATLQMLNAHKISNHVQPSRQSAVFLYVVVIGCDDPIVPDGYWVSRRGDVAEIGCQNSERFWMLECEGNDWIGQYDNCSLEGIQSFPI